MNYFIFQLFVAWGPVLSWAEWNPATIRGSSILQKLLSVFWLIRQSKHLLSKHPPEFWQRKVTLVNQIQLQSWSVSLWNESKCFILFFATGRKRLGRPFLGDPWIFPWVCPDIAHFLIMRSCWLLIISWQNFPWQEHKIWEVADELCKVEFQVMIEIILKISQKLHSICF